VGAIKVEASPWVEDNLWALQVAQLDPMIVGVVGNLRPEKPEFNEYLDRYVKNPLFRGIRYGNLWGYDLAEQAKNPVFIAGLKRLADADLALDSANPNMRLLQAILDINDQVPDLRIVIDHLPGMEPSSPSSFIVSMETSPMTCHNAAIVSIA
jgi:predicted TIM-barrel fold metal-dependent hydrolase